MIAKVVAVESGSGFMDGERRVTLQFADADQMFQRARFRESVLGIEGIKLDDEVYVEIEPVKLSRSAG